MKKIVAMFTMLAVLTACGGGGDRPSEDDIAKALKDSDNPAGEAFGGAGIGDEIIDCIAKALHDSDLSDDVLQALVDGDEDFRSERGRREHRRRRGLPGGHREVPHRLTPDLTFSARPGWLVVTNHARPGRSQ